MFYVDPFAAYVQLFVKNLNIQPSASYSTIFLCNCPKPPDIAPGAAAKIPALNGLPCSSVAADVAAAINPLCANAVPSPVPNVKPALQVQNLLQYKVRTA